MEERSIETAYFSFRGETVGDYVVDDITNADLALDSIFRRIDKTGSSLGQATLYAWMRSPLSSSVRLEERLGPARWLEGHPAERQAVRLAMRRLGMQKRGDMASELWGVPGTGYMRYKNWFHVWSLGSLALIVASLISGAGPVFVILGVCISNLLVFVRTNTYIGAHADSIRYLGRMIGALRAVATIVPEGTGDARLDSLPRLVAVSRKIPVSSPLFGTSGSGIAAAATAGDLVGMVVDYYRIFMLGELRAYFAFYTAFVRDRDAIVAMYATLGAIDACASIAELLSAGGVAKKASVSEAFAGIETEGMIHPLVEACVPVSFKNNKGMVITGTNMSGKSTFLRSLGINMVLAGSLGLAFASVFKAYPYRVISSIDIDDDLIAGKSRYLAEAERLLFIIRACVAGRVLALVDEILSGTNSTDRISASIDILGHLRGTDSLIVAATHDLEIADAMTGLYDAHHFSEKLDSGDFSFDYELKQGVVDRRNAILILKRLGFGEFVRG